MFWGLLVLEPLLFELQRRRVLTDDPAFSVVEACRIRGGDIHPHFEFRAFNTGQRL